MATGWPTDKTTIARLRVRSAGLDPLTAQLRAASVLDTVSLHPAGLPPAAVLCIRSLRDPKPGTLSLRHGDMGAARAWGQAVADTLDHLARQASRPMQGPVPANAQAVLFADYAELLACLARDWLAGDVITRWWWQSLLHGGDGTRSMLAAWLEAPHYIPAALQYLAERGQAVSFAHALSDDATRALLQVLARTFALPGLQAALDTPLDHDRNEGKMPTRSVTAQDDASQPAPQPPGRKGPAAPWQGYVPESQSGALRADQQALLGIGLMLQRAPAMVRSAAFAQAVIAWWGDAHGAERLDQPARDAAQAPPPIGGRLAWVSAAPPPRAEADLSSATPAPATGAPRVPIQPGASPVVDRAELPAADASDGAPAPANPVETEIETGFGGVFYLINLSLFLGLYGDFTTPLTPGLDLPIWDFVALIARAWSGAPIEHDPVWGLLTRLAGRAEGEAPGRTFEPPGEWRLPVEWLAAFPETEGWHWSAGRRRLRVVHPAGFSVLDVRRAGGDPAPQLAAELQAYPAAGLARRRTRYLAAPGRVKPLARWLAWLMPYVEVRLQRALGLSNPEDLPGLVCQHGARVCVTAAHLDICLSVADLPLSIRLAGLDRDPGWVPAAGRFIAFHFE